MTPDFDPTTAQAPLPSPPPPAPDRPPPGPLARRAEGSRARPAGRPRAADRRVAREQRPRAAAHSGHAGPGYTPDRRSLESPNSARRTPTLSMSDRYRLHIFRFGLP